MITSQGVGTTFQFSFAIIEYLLGVVKPQDIVMTLGAGDITRMATEFVAALKSQSTVGELKHE